MSFHSLHACLRSAMARWAARLGTPAAAAEVGVCTKSIRRKADTAPWSDRELASAIAHEVETTGGSTIVADLVAAIEAQVPVDTSERALRTRSLRLGAESSRLSSMIQDRLADGDLSVKDAADIAQHIHTVLLRDLHRAASDLDSFVKRSRGAR